MTALTPPRTIYSAVALLAYAGGAGCLADRPSPSTQDGPRVENHTPTSATQTSSTEASDLGTDGGAADSGIDLSNLRANQFEVTTRFPSAEDPIAPNTQWFAVNVNTTVAAPLELVLTDAAGAVVPGASAMVDCGELGWRANVCVRWTPATALGAGATYALTLQVASPEDPLKIWILNFGTTSEPDSTAPSFAEIECGLDETKVPWGCAMRDDARWVLRSRPNETAIWHTATDSAQTHAPYVYREGEFSYVVLPIDGSESMSLRLVAHDAAANAIELPALIDALPAPALPRVTISEVRADPLGPEPQQEYIELYNFGSEPVELAGMSITDDVTTAGNKIQHKVTLAPEQSALLVSTSFDPSHPQDVPPVAGAVLIRVADKLVTRGLSNSGEALYLRDARGRRISTFSSLPSPKPGVCIQRVSWDALAGEASAVMRSGEPSVFVPSPDKRCTPGSHTAPSTSIHTSITLDTQRHDRGRQRHQVIDERPHTARVLAHQRARTERRGHATSRGAGHRLL
jgi:hypothetical protein